MYSKQNHSAMPPPQQQRSVAPETFLLDQDAQAQLPADSVVALQQVDNLKYFLISAPVDWSQDQYIRRFLLPTGEYVSCVLWNNLFHISGTDIVRCLSFRFQAFGRPVKNSKKFEEGIFSDLRNLKSGTDASLEEPKSPFLDFLYKNNCIRTQKKQKVFYWYSVPHDRLFLDALERDLKREKMGQEATTVAVNEPALSFEFDSSQSLFEQLTKAQQHNSSTFNNSQQPPSIPPSQSTSPMLRAQDSMPPPPMIPQHQMQPPPPMHHQQMPVSTMPQHSMPPAMHDEQMTQMPTYHQQMGMPPMPSQIQKTREQSMGPVFDRNGMPVSQAGQRHSSMPAYMEYSPAPSFASSHYEDYSTRGFSFEPMTPPQNLHGMSAEPAYIANEDTGLYTALPDGGMQQGFNPLMSVPPNLAGAQYPSMARNYPNQHMYSVLEGSPTYKQRRRRSSLTNGGMASAVTSSGGVQAYAAHRPSDLRRSVSSSVVPQPIPEGQEVQYHDSPASLHTNQQSQPMMGEQHKDLLDLSRHSTPLGGFEDMQVPQPQRQPQHMGIAVHTEDYTNNSSPSNPDYRNHQNPHNTPLQHPSVHRTANGVFRRARSATASEMAPYPQKSHSCPIPMCGRLFKRLEHLKRHVRTHTQERPYICTLCNKAFSRSDNLAQHRRTHETSTDGTAPSEEEMEEEAEALAEENGAYDHEDASAGAPLPQSGNMYQPQPPMNLHMATGVENVSSNGGLPTHVDMRALSHEAMGPPPPMPQGYMVSAGNYH